MSKLIELRQLKAEAIKKLREMLDKADAEKRDLTDEETKEYGTIDTSLADFDRKIEREEKLEHLEEETKTVTRKMYHPKAPAFIRGVDDDTEFRSFGEFVHSVVYNPRDTRLKGLETEMRADDQKMADGPSGGFMIPEKFRGEKIFEMPANQAIFRPRAMVMGGTEEGTQVYPMFDQTGSRNPTGGVAITWHGEGGTLTQTDMKFREFKMTPHELGAYVIVTEKLLRNWAAMETWIRGQFIKAIVGEEENKFLNGQGVNTPKGILQQDGKIEISRGTTGAILWADIKNVDGRVSENMGVYCASPSIKPQLMSLKDDSSAMIWHPSARVGEPDSLMGRELVWSERMPSLGQTGDLCLLNLNYYMIQDGMAAPAIAKSEHVYFTSNKIVIRVGWSVDGNSWVKEPRLLEGNTASTYTISPFVILKSS